MVQIFNFLRANVIKMKKTKLPGNNSWKSLIWHFSLYEGRFPGKIQFATPSNVQIRIWTVLNCFSSSLDTFFSLKPFKTFFFEYPLKGFAFDKCFHQKKKERKVWFQLLTVNELSARFFLPIGALAPYIKKEQSDIK